MRTWLTAATTLAVLAGCATGPARPAPVAFAGPPALPATFSVADPSATPLPTRGALGRGVLMYRSPHNAFAPVLVLEDGRQFQLPATPPGEGRQGSLYASLSPDGRWVGHRVAQYAGDMQYVLRELSGNRVVETEGRPLLWSTDSRYVVMAKDDDLTSPLTLVEPATGTMSSMGSARYRDNLWLTGVLPDGQLLYSSRQTRSLRLRTDQGDTTVAFAAGVDDECWCPQSGVQVSPDGRTISVQLAYESGLIPGTGEKSSPMPANSVMVAVIDIANGTVIHRVKPADSGPGDSWWLLSEIGSGLLMRRHGADGTSLVLLDPATGSQHVATELPDGASVVVPGQIDGPSDG